MDDLINRLQARKVFNGNTTIRRDGPGCPWVEERQTVTDPLCAEAVAALTEAQATIARQQVLLNRALESNGDMQITIARLEAALKQIEEQDDDGDMMYHALGPFAKIARAALSPGKGE